MILRQEFMLTKILLTICFLFINFNAYAAEVGCKSSVWYMPTSINSSSYPNQPLGYTYNCDLSYTYTTGTLAYNRSRYVFNYECTDTGWFFVGSATDVWGSSSYTSSNDKLILKYSAVPTYSASLDLPPCNNCLYRREQWGISNCFGPDLIGDASLVTSFNCETNTGTCFNCDAERNSWAQANCSDPGEYVESFDCETRVGDCKTCEEKRFDWGSTNCLDAALIGDPSLVLTYDCLANTGTCDLDCAAKEELWKSVNCSNVGDKLYSFNCELNDGICKSCEDRKAEYQATNCTGFGNQLVSYDCDTDIGVCSDDCPVKQAAWVAANCSGEGQTLVSYDCATDTGVCNGASAECLIAQNNWISAFCSEENDVFISFDCETGHGVCQHGSDFIYTPTDEEQALYTDRFNQFIDDMRQTPLFSLPDQVLGNIPSGGDPVYTVEMGQYGSVDIDLGNYDSLFAICRTIFLVCFSFAALRILLSHR